jgi:hypothetical protein
MKKRVTRILNFFALNLLFFALYLNFVHKDSNGLPEPTTTPVTHSNNNTANVKGSVLVNNPEQYLNKVSASNPAVANSSQF